MTNFIEELDAGDVFHFASQPIPDYPYKVFEVLEDKVSIIQLHKDGTEFKERTHCYFGVEVVKHD